MRPLTDEMPKCLLPINGKPLLQIWMEHLAANGISEVLVNTHWNAGKVERFIAEADAERMFEFGETERWPKVRLFHEDALLGSAGTIWANRAWVEDEHPFYILYGDNLTDVNLRELHRFHQAHEKPFSLGVFTTRHPERCGIAVTDRKGTVIDFVEKPKHPKSDLAAAGIYMADNRIFEVFPRSGAKNAFLDMGFDIIPSLVGQMKAWPIDSFLMDIGTPESYREAQRLWPYR